jgi:hypothetical protein
MKILLGMNGAAATPLCGEKKIRSYLGNLGEINSRGTLQKPIVLKMLARQ